MQNQIGWAFISTVRGHRRRRSAFQHSLGKQSAPRREVKAGDLVITQAWSPCHAERPARSPAVTHHRKQRALCRTGWSAVPAISRARSSSQDGHE